jgi:hypothetical protein
MDMVYSLRDVDHRKQPGLVKCLVQRFVFLSPNGFIAKNGETGFSYC